MWKSRGAGWWEGKDARVFAWRQHRFFVDFLLLALSYDKLEETGKEKEGEQGGGVRLTEFASAQLLCSLLDLYPWNVQ